jgi:hypothetical protein
MERANSLFCFDLLAECLFGLAVSARNRSHFGAQSASITACKL